MRHLVQILAVTILGIGGLSPGAHTQEAAEVSGSKPAGEVARAQFALAVVDREPSEAIQDLSNDNRQIYFWSDLRDLTGTQVLHRWEWNGQVLAEIPFEVAGPRWRVFSSKRLDANWLGEWTVSVVTSTGEVLAQESFAYTAAASAPPAAPAPEPGRAKPGSGDSP